MQKYKYINCNLGKKDLDGTNNNAIEQALNEKGDQGWDLVTTYDRQALNVGQSRTVYLYGIFKQPTQ